MWLHDFLQDDEVLKHCRTMIYGYDASLRSPDISSILDYSKNLVGELTKARAKVSYEILETSEIWTDPGCYEYRHEEDHCCLSGTALEDF